MNADQKARSVVCTGCGGRMIYLRTRTGSRMPVDAETVAEDDHIFDHKRHTSHFATCPKAGDFRRPRKPKPKRNRTT